ncbi:MAG TPA: polyphosphate kinase 2 family protein [Vicinamibacterales bacterium]|jgi:PPK2 family polyphosphate:nucleotide phosphotransferase
MHRDFKALVKPFVVKDGKGFCLGDRPTAGTHPGHDAKKFLKKGVKALCDLQDKLYAQDRHGVLLIFQAIDAAGKDSAIKHVMSGVDPAGCQVYSFKAPSSEELDHDFLWRTSKCLPERGRIGIFNRSYYEEVLIVRVHPTMLGHQKLPAELLTKRIWKERFEDINAFERYFARQGFLILKFFLHVSRKEQRQRFMARLDRPDKNWKFEFGDLAERKHWRAYMAAYDEMIRHTAKPHAPWVIVPADDKKFARTVVAAAIIDGLTRLRLQYPAVDDRQRADLRRAKRLLEREPRR